MCVGVYMCVRVCVLCVYVYVFMYVFAGVHVRQSLNALGREVGRRGQAACAQGGW